MSTTAKILKDILIELEKCLVKDYYGNLVIKINIQYGKVRNVTFAPEKSKKYDT